MKALLQDTKRRLRTVADSWISLLPPALKRWPHWPVRLLNALEGFHIWFAQLTRKVEPLISLAAITMAVLWALGTWNVDPNPDAYYHLGVAAAYAAALAHGEWMSVLPVLPFTILGADPFPNVYLLQHLLLAPLTWVLSPFNAIYVAMGLSGWALLASIYFVLRGWGVRGAIWWTQLVWLASPILYSYVIYLKGSALFLILLVWAVDALVRRKFGQLFVYSWLAGYSYVASYLLVPVAGCFALAALIYRRRWEWQSIAATALGFAAATLINPAFPSNIELLLLEFNNALRFPGAWEAGLWIGAEWQGISLHALGTYLGFAFGPWAVIVLVLAARQQSGRVLGACLVTGLFALALAFYAGSKGASMAAVLYCLLVPLALYRINPRPWLSWVALLWLGGVLAYGHTQGYINYENRSGQSFVQDARRIALTAHRAAGDGKVITAPWSDFPWLFYFNPHNYYVAGMNLGFLEQSTGQLSAYQRLYSGQIRRPEIVLPRCFLSNLLIMHRYPGLEGEQRLLATLRAKKEYFTEIEIAGTYPSARVIFSLNEVRVVDELETLAAAEAFPACTEPPSPQAVAGISAGTAPSSSIQVSDRDGKMSDEGAAEGESSP